MCVRICMFQKKTHTQKKKQKKLKIKKRKTKETKEEKGKENAVVNSICRKSTMILFANFFCVKLLKYASWM